MEVHGLKIRAHKKELQQTVASGQNFRFSQGGVGSGVPARITAKEVEKRAVRITVQGRDRLPVFGSGLLIAPSLVLTALHVLYDNMGISEDKLSYVAYRDNCIVDPAHFQGANATSISVHVRRFVDTGTEDKVAFPDQKATLIWPTQPTDWMAVDLALLRIEPIELGDAATNEELKAALDVEPLMYLDGPMEGVDTMNLRAFPALPVKDGKQEYAQPDTPVDYGLIRISGLNENIDTQMVAVLKDRMKVATGMSGGGVVDRDEGSRRWCIAGVVSTTLWKNYLAIAHTTGGNTHGFVMAALGPAARSSGRVFRGLKEALEAYGVYGQSQPEAERDFEPGGEFELRELVSQHFTLIDRDNAKDLICRNIPQREESDPAWEGPVVLTLGWCDIQDEPELLIKTLHRHFTSDVPYDDFSIPNVHVFENPLIIKAADQPVTIAKNFQSRFEAAKKLVQDDTVLLFPIRLPAFEAPDQTPDFAGFMTEALETIRKAGLHEKIIVLLMLRIGNIPGNKAQQAAVKVVFQEVFPADANQNITFNWCGMLEQILADHIIEWGNQLGKIYAGLERQDADHLTRYITLTRNEIDVMNPRPRLGQVREVALSVARKLEQEGAQDRG